MTDTAKPTASETPAFPERPEGATAALVLADGTVFWGRGAGAAVIRVGEVCFNTAMTGYQEIMTDPSYAGQIVTFTFPHIGNVGANMEDIETMTPAACGAVLRAEITEPSNFRAASNLDGWLKAHDLPAIAGIDTPRADPAHSRPGRAQWRAAACAGRRHRSGGAVAHGARLAGVGRHGSRQGCVLHAAL